VTVRYFIVRDMHESIIFTQFVCLSKASAKIVVQRRFALEKEGEAAS
jgi:hypothetical protein